jgi:Cytochrome c
MRRVGKPGILVGMTLFLFIPNPEVPGGEPDTAAAERGREALTSTGYLKPAWSAEAYRNVSRFWESGVLDPSKEPELYASVFNHRYGLAPAPYPNDGLPMGLRRGNGPGGTKVGLAIDCMACHGGSIGGTSYVGLGNTQLDITTFFHEMLKADGKRPPLSPFIINSSRGTVNAGMFSVVLLSLRNPDLSFRKFPLTLGANIPELDVPAWWLLGKKSTMYYDGRTNARSVRTNMQFMLGEKTLAEFKELEPTYRDIQAFFKSLKPPKYPFPIDREKADLGKIVYNKTCAKCHGTYGEDGKYPNRIVELDEIGTDPARARGISPRFVTHYNSTWFGEDFPVDEVMTGYQAPPLDGVWATAPYLHNGSVPTLATLLKSADRPSKFYRPPSTDFEHYDTVRVGWKFEVPREGSAPDKSKSLFDSSRFGLSNSGHTFGDKLTDEERTQVIEYLKTL